VLQKRFPSLLKVLDANGVGKNPLVISELNSAIVALTRADVIVVVAAGNENFCLPSSSLALFPPFLNLA
jgi:hypothetical protein